MTQDELLAKLLDVHKASMAMFDAIEERGAAAPLDDPRLIISWLQPIRDIEEYYRRRNVHRLLALGVSPETLLKLSDGDFSPLEGQT